MLVVHGAAVTAQVLETPGLRLVCCARGGPVNVDLQAARDLGVPVTNTPGKNAEAVVELTVAFMIMLARGISRSQQFLLNGGELGTCAFEAAGGAAGGRGGGGRAAGAAGRGGGRSGGGGGGRGRRRGAGAAAAGGGGWRCVCVGRLGGIRFRLLHCAPRSSAENRT